MDNLWHIDKNPTQQIEDGELIGDDDNELNNKIKNDIKIIDNKDDKNNHIKDKNDNSKDKNDNLKDKNDNIVKRIAKDNSINDNQKINKKQTRKSKFNNKKNDRSGKLLNKISNNFNHTNFNHNNFNQSTGNQYTKNSFHEFDKTEFDKLSNDQLKEKLRTQFERVKAFNRPNQMNNQMNNQINNQYFNPLQNNHQQQFRNMQFNPANQFNQMPMDFMNPINQHMNNQMNNNINQQINHQMRMPNQLYHNQSQLNSQFNPQQHNQTQFNQNRPFDSIDRKKFNEIDKNFKKLNKKLVDDDSKKVDQNEMIEMLKEMHDFLLSKYKGTKNGKNFNKKRELSIDKNDRPNKQFKSKHKQNQQINLHINLQDPNSIEINQSQSSSFDPIITTDSFNNNSFINNNKKFNSNSKSNKKKFNQKIKKPKKINEVCKYYVQDFCVNGNDCNYLHKEFPCKFYHLFDSCSQDEYSCKFSHQPLNEEMKILLNNFVQRNQELKDFKQDKVLLGDATTTMKNSLNTWEWQQEICKLHNRKKIDDQNKELFRISDEFLLQNKPASDLIAKNTFYSQNNDQQNNLKNEDSVEEELDPDELVALEEIRLIEEANERKEKAEKARKLNNDQEIKKELFTPPIKSSNNKELYQRREDLLNKENNLFNNKYDNKLEELIKMKNSDLSTTIDKNSNLFNFDSKIDCKINLLSSSDFLNRLVDETRIDNKTKESDKLDDQFNKLFNRNNKEQINDKEKIEIKIDEQDDNEINLNDKTNVVKEEEIRMTNNLINEIIRGNNSIISPQSPSSSRQNSISDKADSSSSLIGDYVQISNELDEYCSQKNLFQNLANLSNDYYNSNLDDSNKTIKTEKLFKINDDECIISRSNEDNFEFKLYVCEFDKSKSLEKYEQFYLYNEKAKFDPRLYKYFSTSNAFKDIQINDQSLNSILNQITLDKSNSSSNCFSLSNLSNLRKMKNDECKNVE